MGDRSFPSAESKFSKPGAEITKASTKRVTLAGFVSSAVLKSDNNGLFSAQATEEVKERTEAEERRLEAQSRADARTSRQPSETQMLCWPLPMPFFVRSKSE